MQNLLNEHEKKTAKNIIVFTRKKAQSESDISYKIIAVNFCLYEVVPSQLTFVQAISLNKPFSFFLSFTGVAKIVSALRAAMVESRPFTCS